MYATCVGALGEKWVLGAPKQLELQVIERHLTWVLGTEPGTLWKGRLWRQQEKH